MKRIMIIAVMLVLASTIVFGSGRGDSGTTSSGKTEITVQLGNWWEQKSVGMKEEFERLHPQYTLRFELLPVAGYFDNAAVAILAGTAPDVLDIEVTNIPTFADRNLLRDITQSVGSRLRAADYVKSAWDSSFYKGRMYGFPTRTTGNVIYYNMNVFDEAGVPYPHEGWTWDDYLSIAQRLTVPGVRYGAGMAVDPSDRVYVFSSLSPILWAFGGDYFSEDGKKCLMNSQEAIRAITFYTELYTRHRVVPEGSVSFAATRDVAPLFAQGRVAMYPHGMGGIQQFGGTPNLRFGIAQTPGRVGRAGAWALTIPSSTPETHIQGAVDYILWYSRADVQARHSEIEPSNIAAWDMAPPWNTPLYQEFRTASNNGRALPTISAWGGAMTIMITELQNVLLQRKTPQQAANDMVRLIDPLL